jgi:hypothetical protein
MDAHGCGFDKLKLPSCGQMQLGGGRLDHAMPQHGLLQRGFITR